MFKVLSVWLLLDRFQHFFGKTPLISMDKNCKINVTMTKLTKKKLAEELADLDALDDDYLPLSELVLQRKITEKDDKLKAAIEVEVALWEHGRNRIAENGKKSRTSG